LLLLLLLEGKWTAGAAQDNNDTSSFVDGTCVTVWGSRIQKLATLITSVFNGPETVTDPRPRKLVSRQRLRLAVGKCPVRI